MRLGNLASVCQGGEGPMYWIYRKRRRLDGIRYCEPDRISLWGCRRGLIPQLLKRRLPLNSAWPLKWHLFIPKALAQAGRPSSTIVIDLKPEKDGNVSLYELRHVWGHCLKPYTPLLLELRCLFVDVTTSNIDKSDFIRDSSSLDKPAFCFLYLNGTVADGTLQGKWIPPGPSPTNGALLWPATLKWFLAAIGRRHPRILASTVRPTTISTRRRAIPTC